MRLLPAGSKYKLPKTFVTLGLWHFCYGWRSLWLTSLPNHRFAVNAIEKV